MISDLFQTRIFYIFMVTVVFWLLMAIINYIIKNRESMRVENLEGKKYKAPLKTKAPFNSSFQKLKHTAINNVVTRFSIIRKLIVFFLGGFWLILVLIPFLGKIPAAVATVLTTGGAIIIGMAARPFIENIISGIIITFSKHLNVNDTVDIDNQYGIVEDITLTHTVIKRWDWQRYLIPNSTIMQKELLNYSLKESYQWAYVEFWVASGQMLENIKQIAVSSALESPYIMDKDHPQFWVMNFEKDSIKCWIAGWVANPSDGWMFKSDVRTRIFTEFERQGIRGHVNFAEIEMKKHQTPFS